MYASATARPERPPSQRRRARLSNAVFAIACALILAAIHLVWYLACPSSMRDRRYGPEAHYVHTPRSLLVADRPAMLACDVAYRQGLRVPSRRHFTFGVVGTLQWAATGFVLGWSGMALARRRRDAAPTPSTPTTAA